MELLTHDGGEHHGICMTSEPTKELLTLGGEHHGIGDEGGLVVKKIEDPPLRSPKRTPGLASR